MGRFIGDCCRQRCYRLLYIALLTPPCQLHGGIQGIEAMVASDTVEIRSAQFNGANQRFQRPYTLSPTLHRPLAWGTARTVLRHP
jgi:hypothetical protein